MSQQEDSKNSSSWPARLLHVDSLISHAREPGDIYGDYTKPPYNAISYTWGRFRLRNGEQPEVKAMPIGGISWAKYMPRMNPLRFSNEDMLRTIKTSVSRHGHCSSVDFVWLDIACIDQTPNSKEMAREIGRQAMIFRGATEVYIWLTTIHTSFLLSALEKMDAIIHAQFHGSIGSIGTPAETVLNWIQDASELLSTFTADEWFSSTWTLQEAFLSPKGIFVFKDGLPPSLVEADPKGGGLLRLDTWIQQWHSVRSLAQDLSDRYPQAVQLSQTIKNLGFLEGVKNQSLTAFLTDTEFPKGFMGNPFNLLLASAQRVTTKEEDRVYAIMQVFDLQLGKSAPGAGSTSFSLQQLQIQLAAALVAKYPLISQIIIQNEDCPTRNAWMISPSLSLPEEAYRAWNHLALGGGMSCRALIKGRRNSPCDAVWTATFSGPMSPLPTYYYVVNRQMNYINTRLLLDRRWRKVMPNYEGPISTGEIHKIIAWLLSKFDNPSILLLGRLLLPPAMEDILPVGHEFCNWAIGILMIPKGLVEADRCGYMRVGVIIWRPADLAQPHGGILELSQDAKEYIFGDGASWVDQEGLFC